MSVTVRDCLRLPSLEKGEVLTGENGLDNIVSTVSVLEDHDDTDQYFAPGEMVITSLFTVGTNAEKQCRLVRLLWEQGVSALVILRKDEIPGGVDRHAAYAAGMVGLPLIFLSADENVGVGYGTLIREIMSQKLAPLSEKLMNDREKSDAFTRSIVLNKISRKFADLIIPVSSKKVVSDNARTYMAERCIDILFDPATIARSEELMKYVTENTSREVPQTMATYLLDGNGEVKKTAALLNVHRNTILYRLNAISELLGMDVDSMPVKYDLTLACALDRLDKKA